MELRQLLFIQVSLGVDASFIAELKHTKNKHKRLSWLYPFFLFVSLLLYINTSHTISKQFSFFLTIDNTFLEAEFSLSKQAVLFTDRLLKDRLFLTDIFFHL